MTPRTGRPSTENPRKNKVGIALTDDLPTDSVEMVRAIRQKHYEETKDMSREARREYYRKKTEKFHQSMETIDPNAYDFPFLRKK